MCAAKYITESYFDGTHLVSIICIYHIREYEYFYLSSVNVRSIFLDISLNQQLMLFLMYLFYFTLRCVVRMIPKHLYNFARSSLIATYILRMVVF